MNELAISSTENVGFMLCFTSELVAFEQCGLDETFRTMTNFLTVN